MILPDTSVWIDHLSRPNPIMAGLLAAERIVVHPFVIGELALGSIASRERVLARLGEMPKVRVAAPEQVAFLIEHAALWSRGIGYVDAHLLAAARIEVGTHVWTRDRRLHVQAERLGVAFAP